MRAAEVAAGAGASVVIYDAKPSVGRKFLVAGKSGLNLTNSAGFEDFVRVYSGDGLPQGMWRECLASFDSKALCEWAAGLGIETFPTSSGKVFPRSMKAAPLLRRWVERLRAMGVVFAMNHRWQGLQPGSPLQLKFQTREGEFQREHEAVVLAMGGASWPQTGSDGGWVKTLESLGVAIRPLQAANCGWECEWTDATRAQVEGKPLHNIHIWAGEERAVGEVMLTRYGIEGTLMYHLGRALRAMENPAVHFDLKPTFTEHQLVAKMESARRNFLKEARQRWKLTEAACAMVEQFHGPFDSAASLAKVVKDCRIPLSKPRPLAEAISTAGGVAWSELDENLMVRRLPGVYCAGEMIDWEAPTGGYLLQGCFATGTWAGLSSVRYGGASQS